MVSQHRVSSSHLVEDKVYQTRLLKWLRVNRYKRNMVKNGKIIIIIRVPSWLHLLRRSSSLVNILST